MGILAAIGAITIVGVGYAVFAIVREILNPSANRKQDKDDGSI